MRKNTTLANDTEAVVLASLIRGELYGLQVRDEYRRRTGVDMPLGTVYALTDRMEKKGLLSSRLGESTAERGGGRRRYFKITGAGMKALNALREAIELPKLGGLANA